MHGAVVLIPFVFPFVILFGLMLLDRLERRLERDPFVMNIEEFINEASVDELERFYREGTQVVVDKYWRRQRKATL